MESPQGILAGVALSRTIPPAIPPLSLSRRHLFPLLENEAPGSTLVIAPQGFGKTALVAEWASQFRERVIWLTVTETDSLQEMSSYFIQATRNILPGFGAWFEGNQPMSATEVVRRWGNELLTTKQNYIFVLDNLRKDYKSDVDISNRLLEQFPSNVHFVAIRRTPLESLNRVLASRGMIKTVSSNDLRFNVDEVASLAELNLVDLSIPAHQRAANAAQGWPSATSLILNQLKSKSSTDFESLMRSHASPLVGLAREALTLIGETELQLLTRLSIDEVFNHQLAHEILGEMYSFEIISALGTQGEIISFTNSTDQTYQFSPLMRLVLLEQLNADHNLVRELHIKLSQFFIFHNRADKAMDHAFAAGDQETVSKLFRDASRIKHSQGKGDDLLRWANYAGHSPVDGTYKRETMEIAGLLANLDFEAAKAKIAKLRATSHAAVDSEFFAQFAESSAAFIYFAEGDFSSLEKAIARVFESGSNTLIGVEEQVMCLRLAAQKAFILDDAKELEKINAQANEAIANTTSETAHAYLGAIKSMTLFEKGEYRQSFEAATISLRNFQRNGIVGLLGPVDIHYVIARCLLEFSRREEAYEHFSRVINLSRQWRQWPWYVMADGYFSRDFALQRRFHEALDRIRKCRDFIVNLNLDGDLQLLIDFSEIFTKHQMRDFDRVDVLVRRGLKTRYIEQMRLAVDEQRGIKGIPERIKNLPGNNPRELIWKHLADALAAIDSEKLALVEMKKALKVGAESGARETFLRQGAQLGNLIIKIANENPTVYNEDLARAMAERIREREMTNTDDKQPLTKRELEILRHLATGRTLSLIASELHISQNTMKTHLKNLYKKLEAQDRHDAIEKAKALLLF